MGGRARKFAAATSVSLGSFFALGAYWRWQDDVSIVPHLRHILYEIESVESMVGSRFPFLPYLRDIPRCTLPSLNFWLLLRAEGQREKELLAAVQGEQARENTVMDDTFLSRALNFLYFSESAYPKDFMLALDMELLRIPSALVIHNKDDDEKEALCARTGIDDEDLLLTRSTSSHLRRMFPFGGEVSKPSCFVAWDKKDSSVVVAIRGTASVSDALTDCLCFTTDFPEAGEGVEAHEGVVLASRHVVRVSAPSP